MQFITQSVISKIGLFNSYCVCAGIALGSFVLVLGLSTLIPHNHREFFELDPSLSYYHKGNDEVQVYLLYLLVFLIPTGITGLSFALSDISWWASEKIKHFTKLDILLFLCSTFAYALLTTACVTEIIKVIVSRPRPEFFYLCNYKGYADAVDSGNYTNYFALTKPNTFGSYDDCYDQSMVSEATSSFPSGHTSMSFASMLFTTFVIQLMFDIANFFTLYGMISFSPLIVSTWIACSRILDYKHREDDVIGGAIIGIVCTIIAWRSLHVCLTKIRKHFERATASNGRFSDDNGSGSGNELYFRLEGGVGV